MSPLVRQTIRFANQEWTISREPFSSGYPVYSGVMFCPLCRRVWAELEIEGKDFFEPRGIPCVDHPSARHRDLRPVPGSLLDNPTCNGIDLPLLHALPPELLQREFELALKYIESETP